MPQATSPRHGSMQVWPRKRAKRHHSIIRSWPYGCVKEAKILGFAGYKAGMTHLIVSDNRQNSKTKGMDIVVPSTVIECPPIRVIGVRFYKNKGYGTGVSTEFLVKGDRELSRTICQTKKEENSVREKMNLLKAEDYADIRLLVQTQPRLTTLPKKKPEVFELGINGSPAEKFAVAKDKLGKELHLNDVFVEGQQLDVHGVTKGKGFQGPVKRFGVHIRQHKAEKTKRGPASLGAWCGQGHMMYRVAHAGQMGYHQRTEFNKHIIKIDSNVQNINPKGGFKRYGLVKNQYMILAGSVFGPSKRLLKFAFASRPRYNIPSQAPAVKHINLESKQGK